MVRCVCVCVCEERSPLFGCCSGGTGSSPHLPVPTHTLRCLHAVTPHRFHGNPRARWNVTGEYGGHLNNAVMMIKECSSFLQPQETRGNMTSQTLAQGSKFSQLEDVHHALGGGGYWLCDGEPSESCLWKVTNHIWEMHNIKTWGKSRYTVKKCLGLSIFITKTQEPIKRKYCMYHNS